MLKELTITILSINIILGTGIGLLLIDIDNDGIQTITELNEFTDPLNKDTDDDGLLDGEEVHKYETDPVHKDTDNDRLLDGEEVHKYETDPLSKDTDDDGLTDYEEVHKYETDPLSKDTDDDGLTDYKEVHKYETDPLSKDTDDDGLTDYKEINTYETDPLSKDTDDDRVHDYDELDIGLDPTDQDTDADGFIDGYELELADSTSIFRDADPLRKNVYIEIDSMDGIDSVSLSGVRQIESTLETAPIRNPDNSHGITTTVFTDDTNLPYQDTITYTQFETGLHRTSHDFKNMGVYHAVIVNEIHDASTTQTVVGATRVGGDALLLTSHSSDTARTLLHELGHGFGLSSDRIRGVDSYAYSPQEYPSIMNYNAINCQSRFVCDTHITGFSDGSHGIHDHNDWEYINTTFEHNAPDTNEIQSIIE